MKASLFIARFPYQNTECPASVDWVLETILKAKQDPRIGDIWRSRPDDTPIPMTRNLAVEQAKAKKVDFLLMIDSDMDPDLPGERPFWDSSLTFALAHKGPCVVAAPYCGPPPHENVYVFRFSNRANQKANPDWRVMQYGREEASLMTGIQRVHALPTGLILIDMRVFARLQPPYFYYEWTDEFHMKKASTEDVTFTRDLTLRGVPCYCNWDSWAGHWKRYRVEKPVPVCVEHISAKYREAILKDRGEDDKLVDVPPEGVVGTADGKYDPTPDLRYAPSLGQALIEASMRGNGQVQGDLPAHGHRVVDFGPE